MSAGREVPLRLSANSNNTNTNTSTSTNTNTNGTTTTNTSSNNASAGGNTDTVDANKLHMLVYSFLLQNNCGGTAKAFAHTSGLATSGYLTSDSTPTYLTSFDHVSSAEKANLDPAVCGRKDSGTIVTKGDPIPEQQLLLVGENQVDRANKLVDHHIEYLHIRQMICSSIEAGEPKMALDLLSTYFPTVFAPSSSSSRNALPFSPEYTATLLRFRLDTQCYIELIANHKELEALKFGQRTLWQYPDIFDSWLSQCLQQPHPNMILRDEIKRKRAEVMQQITNVAALVAYPDPTKCSLAYLLEQDRRSELAREVNDAILASMQYPREPALVTLVRQLATTSAYLVGCRSSLSLSAAGAALAAGGAKGAETGKHEPWVLDTFVNSDVQGDDILH
ncbi:CTLH/CRA C-terminal to lish motif domain-containing protein [Kickxella alabastrina]|uniref:CTLH/CRA C-terminal to lish motif domain-containing protein n=1 Tax=Kickxella alabastrina TaxID=61397 RepID=UPI002220995A|nr:CTLH/CRA C-terminal to lish motif domain-containing protein [Kickxella alabastrina]KAI7822299.1 CTLH/CRA C-terminal to lish motif domain-containing protein [Kickxella alabastrina]